MIKYEKNNTIIINNDIYLTPICTLKDIITSLYPWEKWITNSQGKTVAYRLVLGKAKNRYGRLFLVTHFTSPANENALLSSWYLAPEKLMDGIQNSPKGKITHNLKQWFHQETGIKLPIASQQMHISVSYDPWNSSGSIICHYRSGFNSDIEWKTFHKQNKG